VDDIEFVEHLLAAQCRAKLVMNNTTNPHILEHVIAAILSLEKAKQLIPKTIKEWGPQEKE